MIYLEKFEFPTARKENKVLADFYADTKEDHYKPMSAYPFGVLANRGLHSLDFEEITILYGGNGSGKSTAINTISSKLEIPRNSMYNKGDEALMEKYLDECKYKEGEWGDFLELKDKTTLITSDDVFKYMFDVRSKNEYVRKHTKDAVREWLWLRKKAHISVDFETGEGRKELGQILEARNSGATQFISKKVGELRNSHSNGETGFIRFVESIEPDRLYLLDEPENSLSCALQRDLAQHIEESVRYFGCQFIIATHSPFLLAIHGAKIYNLDGAPASISNFWELPNMRLYYELFQEYEKQFSKASRVWND
jgi:predicted ATPase